MTKVHILPARPHSADQAARLSADLRAAHEQGLDLGSRGAHIRANGEVLLMLSQALEHAVGALHGPLSQLGMQDQPAQDAVHRLLSEVRKVADRARQFPDSF